MRLSKQEVHRLTTVLRTNHRPKDLPVGSLVTLASWCENSGRLAHVVANSPVGGHAVQIQYLDEEGQRELPVNALASNLILLEEQ